MGTFYAKPFIHFCPPVFFSGVGDFHAIIMLEDSYSEVRSPQKRPGVESADKSAPLSDNYQKQAPPQRLNSHPLEELPAAQMENEETIQRIRYQNELILNSAGEGIFGLDLQGNATFVNPAAAKMLGYKVEELVGKGSHGLIHHTKMDGSPYPEAECPIYATFRKGEVFHIEEDIFWRKNGTGFPVEYTCTPILEKGMLAGAVVTFLDVTRRKVAEAKRREEAGQLRERVKELNCLFSISELFRKSGPVQAEIFQGIVDRIPPAWLYPEIACARLVLENREFRTGNFRQTPWKAAADIRVNGQPKGFLEVCYREEKDWGAEGPFLPEEISLLEEIAERTCRFIERVEAQEALRESEAKFRVLFEQAAVGVAQIETATGRFMRINQRYGDIIGYSQEEMISRTFQEITYPEDLQEDLRNMEELVAGKIREFSMEKRYHHKNGDLTWVHLTVSPMWAPGELPDYHIAVVQDITKRKRAEEARKQIEERVRILSQQLLRSQEEERRRISRELHDDIGQNLSALKIGLEGPWTNQLEGLPEVRQKFKECSQILQETIQGVRDMAHNLRPSSIDQLGLVKAAQQYCEEFSAKHRIQVDFITAGIDDAFLDYDTRIALYRLIQEGLININKHAAATLAVIRLVSSFPNIILRIEDNGQGFDVIKRQSEAVEEKRLGLSSMEERVTLLQGKMKIDSQPGQGTRVFIEIPSQVSNGK